MRPVELNFFTPTAAQMEESGKMKKEEQSMCRKIISLSAILVFSFVCHNIALGDAQIGDWELSMDGWESWNPNNIITYSSTTGVTSGSYSLRVDSNKPSSNYWYSTELGYKFIGEEARNAFFDSSFFGFYVDVTTLASEWLPNTNAGWIYGTDLELIINAGDNDGNSIWSVAQSYSHWDPSAADFSSTLNFNYAAQIQTLRNWGLDHNPTEGWIEFVLLAKYPTFESPPDGTGDGGVYYLDNAWLYSPEPASIALLGLGALTLFRRRK